MYLLIMKSIFAKNIKDELYTLKLWRIFRREGENKELNFLSSFPEHSKVIKLERVRS